MDKTQQTILAYDRHTEAYTAKFMDFHAYKERVLEFTAALPSHSKILDLGCGPGNVLKHILSTGKSCDCVGVDLSQSMIEEAQTQIPEGAFYCQDIRTFDIPERDFDAIILSFCIVHLFEDEAISVIQHAARLLKPRGKLYLSFMTGKPSQYETTSFSPDAIYFTYYDVTMIIEVLKQVGIVVSIQHHEPYRESDGTLTTDIFLLF